MDDHGAVAFMVESRGAVVVDVRKALWDESEARGPDLTRPNVTKPDWCSDGGAVKGGDLAMSSHGSFGR